MQTILERSFRNGKTQSLDSGFVIYNNECRVGVNIGGGADFALTSSWIMNFELRYQLVSDFDQAVFNLGFAYRF